jgi:hypothetical protein
LKGFLKLIGQAFAIGFCGILKMLIFREFFGSASRETKIPQGWETANINNQNILSIINNNGFA